MKSPLRTEAGLLTYGRTNKREAAVLQFAKQVQAVTWDFSKDGGAIGDIGFGVSLPAGAIVTSVLSDEETAVTGATSVTLKAGSTSLTGAINFTTDAGIQSRALAGSAAGIKLSSASELKITVATAAATAGKVTFYVEFIEKP
jgi:hypothetical protein